MFSLRQDFSGRQLILVGEKNQLSLLLGASNRKPEAKEVNVTSMQTLQQETTLCGPQFQFRHNRELTATLSGKTVQAVDVCEVASTEFSPVALRLCIRFTDGSCLMVDRQSTALPRAKRKVLHLDLSWQSNKRQEKTDG